LRSWADNETFEQGRLGARSPENSVCPWSKELPIMPRILLTSRPEDWRKLLAEPDKQMAVGLFSPHTRSLLGGCRWASAGSVEGIPQHNGPFTQQARFGFRHTGVQSASTGWGTPFGRLISPLGCTTVMNPTQSWRALRMFASNPFKS
jgi:hypothetical protein